MRVSRREALMLGAFGTVGAAGLALPLGESVKAKGVSELADQNMPRPYQTAFAHQQVLRGVEREDANGRFTLFEVTERLGYADIVPGLKTPVFGYNGTVPGPLIKVHKGTRVKLRVRNQLPALHPKFGHPFNTSTHLHGSASLPHFDGYADDITHPGDYKEYWYPNWQAARTIWYHDHNVHTTSENAYSGLSAQYHITDAAEQELLPQGAYDVPITISDAMFAADGSLSYDDRSHSGLMGDVILVNGKPWPVLKVKRRIYRFRVLNASISRSLRLRLSNRAPMVMVATDGGLMPQARPTIEYRHAGSERYEFLIDFSKYSPGTNIDLLNESNKNNVDFDHTNKVMRFQVVDDGDLPPDTTRDRTLAAMPNTLVSSEAMSLRATDVSGRYYMRLGRDDVTNIFEINSKSWHDVVDSGYKDLLTQVQPDAVQEWDIENKTGGGWFHPLHIHLVDFQIVSRNGQPAFDYEKGPKDVVYVGEDETVRVRMKFTLQEGGGNSRNPGGRYMVHCHNLPHEDHDMMHQFAVGDPNAQDPIKTAPCRYDDGNYDDGWEPGEDAPTVKEMYPGDGAPRGTNVRATFDEDVTGVDETTMILTSASGLPVPAVVTLNDGARVAALNPVSALDFGTTYTLRLTSGITSAKSGVPLEPFAWSFTTEAASTETAPSVTKTVPADGATGVLRGSNMTATFSEPVTGVDTTTMTMRSSTGQLVSAVVTLNDTRRVAILNPDLALARSTTYTVTCTGGATGIRNDAGTPIQTTSWSFTTSA